MPKKPEERKNLPDASTLVTILKTKLHRKRSKRSEMASVIAGAFPKSVPLRQLADAGKADGKSYGRLLEAHGDNGSGALRKSATEAFKAFFKSVDGVLATAPELREFKLRILLEGRVAPQATVRIGQDAPIANETDYLRRRGLRRCTLVRIGDDKYEVSPFHAHVGRKGFLHVVPIRAGKHWLPPHPKNQGSYEKWAAKMESHAHLFSPPDNDWFDAFGHPKKDSFYSEPTDSTQLFNGWLWGCLDAELQNRYSDSQTLRLELLRIYYRDHRAFTAKLNMVAIPSGKRIRSSAWLHDRWWRERKGRERSLLPLHNVLKICALAVVPSGRQDPYAILTFRHNRAKNDDANVGYWTASATGHCVSERLREDDRPPGPEVQAQRLIRRQLGFEVSPSELRWVGATLGEDFSVTLYCVINIHANASEVIDLFERRTMRHDAKRIALVSREKILGIMRRGDKLTARSLLGESVENDTCSPFLSSTLALWLLSTGHARRNKDDA